VSPKVVEFPRGRPETKRHRAVLPRAAMPEVDCAFCGSSETEPTSIYGSHMLTSQYFCHGCKSSFDWVRDT
jgi:transposase-like protein